MGCYGQSENMDESLSGLSSEANCLFPVETAQGEVGNLLGDTEKGVFDESRDFEGCRDNIVEQLSCAEPDSQSLNYKDNADMAGKLVIENGMCFDSSEEACLVSNAYLDIEDRPAVFLSPECSNVFASMNSGIDQGVCVVGRDGKEEDVYLGTVLSGSEQIPESDVAGNVADQVCLSGSTTESLMENKECQCVDGIGNSLHEGEIGLPLSSLNGSLSKCTQLNEHKDVEILVPSEGTSKDQQEIVKEKDEVLLEASNALMTRVSDTEQNTCNVIEGPSNIASECVVEDSASLQLSQHFGVLDISSFDCSRMQHHEEFDSPGMQNQKTIDNSGGPPSCCLIESTVQADDEGKDIVKPDFAPMTTSADIIQSPPQRRMRQRNIVKMIEPRKSARRSRKPTDSMLSDRAIALSLEITRGKRSCLPKRARSSIWGTLGNIIHVFTENDVLLKQESQFNQIEKPGSQKRKGGQGSRRLKSTRAGGSSRTSKKGSRRAMTGRICLKVKMGGGQCPTSSQIVLPDVIDSLVSPRNVLGERVLESDCQVSLDVSKLADDGEHKIEENVHGIRQLTSCRMDLENPVIFPGVSVRDIHLRDISVVNALGDLDSTVTQDISAVNNTLGDCSAVFSQSGIQTLGKAVGHQYSDPGTSPDSEVINVIQDDSVFSCSQIGGPIDVTNSKKMKSKQKGKKNSKVRGSYPSVGNAPGEDKFLGLSNLTKTRKSALCRPVLGLEDGLNLTDTVISSTIGNVSISSSCIKGYPMESFPVAGVVKLGPRLNVDTFIESCELSGDVLQTSGTIGLELPNCPQSSSGLNKHKSRAPDSAKRRSGNSRKKEKGDTRKSINKSKVKEKDILAQVASMGDNHLEIDEDVNICSKTGKHSDIQGPPELDKINVMGPDTFDDQEKTNIGNDFESEDMSKSSLASKVSDEQFLLPRSAWVRCDDCHKWRCISAELADSIEETNCQWTCKDNMDKAFGDCSIPQEKTNAEINAELEISDASCEEDVCDTNSNRKGSENRKGFEAKQLTVSKPSSWTHIKCNLFLHRRRKTQTIDEIMVCHCKPPQDGQLGCGDECLNRMLNIECVHGTCPCGDLCSNQQFQKRKYAKFKWFRSGKKGFGLQLQQNVSQGAFLIEYVGEVLDLHSYEVRQKEYASRGQKHFYFMTLNGSEVIDACAKGNLGRFINHSCDPNCRTEKWMVNGEVCIGLFALRDLKKGEEVTFDYNYVRVFGAAAKRCVCGSPECRGYIGGDPLNTEVVVQGDSDEEYPEPVMLPEDSYSVDMDNIVFDSSLTEGALVQHGEGSPHTSNTKITSSIEQFHNTLEREDSWRRSVSSVQVPDLSLLTVDTTGKSPSHTQEVSLQPGDITNKSSSDVNPLQLSVEKEGTECGTFVTIQPLEASSLTTNDKVLADSVEANRTCISDTVEDKPNISKSPHKKSSRSSISIKKSKSISFPVTTNKPRVLANKPKKVLEGAPSSRGEGVEDTLNELLDADGGISKRKDSTKGYLKLLLVTAASGDNVNGEAVQSTRDLSIILDALLKTKSRMVLGDIINKNGLQMMHNIMKQNRRNFNKTPIIRKLLKVLEYLASKKILTVDHINSGPPCAGIESFRESIFQLTRHSDVQVHQIARNFRDTYIPRQNRRTNYSNRENGNFDMHNGSSFSRLSSSSYRRWNDQEGARSNDTINAEKHLGNSGPCSDGYPTNGAKTRKRKSRWDQPAETNPENPQPPEIIMEDQDLNLKQKLEADQQQSGNIVDGERNNGCDQNLLPQDDLMQQIHEDAPPGFPAPFSCSPTVPSNTSSSLSTITNTNSSGCEVITGYLQGRYLSHLPVSYGIPVSFVEQLGTPTQAGMVDSWVIAPSIPFHPFPPLPRFPRDKSSSLPSPSSAMKINEGYGEGVQSEGNCHQADLSIASTSGARPPEGPATGRNNNDQRRVQERMRCSSSGGGSLGKRYFRQQKWVNRRNGPPWVSRRNNGWMGSKGCSSNNSRNGVQNLDLGYVEKSQGLSLDNTNSSTLYQQQEQHPQY